MFRRTLPVALAGFLCLAPLTSAADLIDRTVLFPTADTLRVQVVLRSGEALPGLKLTARIGDAKGDATLWEGPLGSLDVPAGQASVFEHTITGLKPRLWSPGSPTLYKVTIAAARNGSALDTRTARTGFRSVESKAGQILLNGNPIFLCGLAISPPGRGVPEATGFSRDFAYDYVKYMRSKHFNCIRMNFEFVVDPRSQAWFDACDELGMMVYQGCYGSPPTGNAASTRSKDDPPDNLDASVAAYRQVFETYAHHPSIVIYILSNELPYQGTRGKAWHEFLTAAHAKLKAWDSTRLYIGNAGYGEGKEGDINDVHRYWGWYYNSFLTYYNLRKAQGIFGNKDAVQPFTFSECVGSFTSTLGEFNLTFRKQLGAQLHWTGHSGDQAKDALAYQAFMAKHACESFRTMREVNPRLAGLMPFTILYYNWNNITSFEQMKPKPVADAMGEAYQPILLSWELWTPQVYAGTTIRPWAHVVNDAEDFSDLKDAKLDYRLLDSAGKTVLSAEEPLKPVPYFGHAKVELSIAIPTATSTGDHMLVGTITKGGKTVSQNQVPLFVAGREWHDSLTKAARQSHDLLYDPVGATAKALTAIGIRTKTVTDLKKLPPGARLIIAEDAAPADDLRDFVRTGGRVLLLGQDAAKFKPSWLPTRIEMLTGSANDVEYLRRKRPTSDQMNINIERPNHPVFAGVDRSRLRLWSDYTGWDQTRPGFPAVYPVTRGFKLTRADDLAHTAILANYDRGLEGVAICEMFDGEGSVVFTSLDLVRRIGLDPVADRMLANLVAYLSEEAHPIHPLVDQPIVWGRYATEKGLVTGPLNGLVENCRWVPPPALDTRQTRHVIAEGERAPPAAANQGPGDPKAKPLPDNEGAWNMLPGDQFVPIGRRPYGPYGYNNGTATTVLDKNARTGASFFHAALPPGRRVMITTIENPAKQDGQIEIDLNGRKTSAMIPAGKTVNVRSNLAADSRAVTVRCTGDKHLVLMRTLFE